MIDQTRQAIRFAFRSMRRSKVVTLFAAVSLAAAIGIVTSVFSVLNATVFRPVPYRDANRIVLVTPAGGGRALLSLSEASAIRAAVPAFERTADFVRGQIALTIAGKAEDVPATEVDSGLFTLLGVRPIVGRLPSPTELSAHAPVAVISDALFENAFAGRRTIIGQTLRSPSTTYTIVGVMPAGFDFSNHSDVWIPLVEGSSSAARSRVELIARLKPGATAAHASDQIHQATGRLETALGRERAAPVLSANSNFMGRAGALGLPLALVFMGAAAAILLITCVNVGNLLLARAAERRGEMAIRASLGATRGRIIAQAFTENLCLAAFGCGAGLLLATWAVPLLWQHLPFHGLPPLEHFGLDWRVAGVTAGVSVLATLIFGMVPALEAADVDLTTSLKGGSAAVAGRDRMAGGRQGVTTQVGLSIALFTLAVLFGRSFENLRAFKIGFDAENVLQVPVDLEHSVRADAIGARAYVAGAVARAGRLSGIRTVAVRANFNGLIRDSAQRASASEGKHFVPAPPDTRILAPGSRNSPLSMDMIPSPASWVVSPDYFATLGLRVVRGRGFTEDDRAASAPVAVVSDRLAHLLWPGQDPIGKAIRIGARSSILDVVGVVSDVTLVMGDRLGLHGDAVPTLYASERQAMGSHPTLLFRVNGDPLAKSPAIMSALMDFDPSTPLGRPTLLSQGVDGARQVVGIGALLLSILAAVGMLLALVGTYGTVAYDVARRSRELAVRMALGATPLQVARLVVLRDGHRIVVATMVGLLIAFAAANALRFLLFGTDPFSPVAYGSAALCFLGCVVLARLLPTRLLTRVALVDAMRRSAG